MALLLLDTFIDKDSKCILARGSRGHRCHFLHLENMLGANCYVYPQADFDLDGKGWLFIFREPMCPQPLFLII